MKNHHRFVFLFICLTNVMFGSLSLAQSRKDDKLGRFSRSNPFVFASEEYKKYGMSYRFIPKNDKVKAYYTNGAFEYLPKNSEVRVASIQRGQFDHKKGLWVEFFAGSNHRLSHSHVNSNSYYVFLDDLIDIEAKAKVVDDIELQAQKAKEWKETVVALTKSLYYILLLIGIVVVANLIRNRSWRIDIKKNMILNYTPPKPLVEWNFFTFLIIILFELSLARQIHNGEKELWPPIAIYLVTFVHVIIGGLIIGSWFKADYPEIIKETCPACKATFIRKDILTEEVVTGFDSYSTTETNPLRYCE